MTRTLTAVVALLLLLVMFIGVNVLAGAGLRGVRLDLTENRLYTLSDGSRAIARSLNEPLALKLYFSESLASGNPTIQNYGKRVRELLEEYQRAARGKIKLTVVDPEPFSEAEEMAALSGVRGQPSRAGTFYFGLVGTNSTDGREVIESFNPRDEQFLEYEISRMIYVLANPERPVVGLLSSLPIQGSPPNPQVGMPGTQPWAIVREIGTVFDVRPIAVTETVLPDDLDVLVVVHPKGLSPDLEYAIDQFILGGGRALICVDPLCEADMPPGAQQNPMMLFQAERNSDLPTLFGSWGITLEAGEVAGDLDNAATVQIRSGNQIEAISYLAWLSLDEGTLDTDDAVTGRLTSVNLGTAGILTRADDAAVTWEPLIQTSENSMRIPADSLKLMPDFKGLVSSFVSGGTAMVLGARLHGEVPTAFPDGPPSGVAEGAATHRDASDGPIRVVVLTDVDILSDRFWMQEERIFGQLVGYRKLADNGDLIVNVLDNLAGSTDLMSVRARGRYRRPFDRVEEIQRNAEKEFRSVEETLQTELRETEQKINELQRERQDGSDLILTPEQEAEIASFRERRVETRRELRAVQLNLRKDVEALGSRLRFINIGLMPAIVALAAIGLGAYRGWRRSTERTRVVRDGVDQS